MDKWFSECIPCSWQVGWMTEDEAIASAEGHIAKHHAKVPAHIRAEKRIGHVQLRSEDAIGTGMSEGAVTEPTTLTEEQLPEPTET